MMQWIFFDLGGTLIDESIQEARIIDVIISEFIRFGIAYSKYEVYNAMKDASVNYNSVVKGAIRNLSKTEKQYNEVVNRAIYEHELEILYPNVIQTLEQLSKCFHLGVIANQANGAEMRMEQHKIKKYFSVFALSAEVGYSKPDKRIFEYALQQANCQPENAVMVGDRIDNDIYPANMIGMTSIRVLQGIGKYQNPINEMHKPNLVYPKIENMLNVTDGANWEVHYT